MDDIPLKSVNLEEIYLTPCIAITTYSQAMLKATHLSAGLFVMLVILIIHVHVGLKNALEK